MVRGCVVWTVHWVGVRGEWLRDVGLRGEGAA